MAATSAAGGTELVGNPMTVDISSIEVGRCYVTHRSEVRQVLKIEGQRLTYVARGKLAFPAWDRELWRVTTTDAFATEVAREVPSDWCGP
jgi:hypothetical protein